MKNLTQKVILESNIESHQKKRLMKIFKQDLIKSLISVFLNSVHSCYHLTQRLIQQTTMVTHTD